MSAAELRQAAETLRERVKDTYEGPWETDASMPGLEDGEVVIAQSGDDGYCVTDALPIGTAAYIATVHPGVGLALADLLTLVDGAQEQDIDAIQRKAREVARAINGGPS